MRLPVDSAWLFAASVTLSATALAACTPDIGDSCSLSTDCASDGTRICDTSEPGGYCTVLNCTGNNLGSVCPDSAYCVLFNANVPGCPFSAQTTSRTGESQCRNGCGSNSDCRGGYICAHPNAAPWFAEILDPDQTAQVCLPALSFIDGGIGPESYGYSGPLDAVPAVCLASGPSFDAGFPPLDAGVDAAPGAPDAAPDAEHDAGHDAAHPDSGARDAGADSAVDAAHDGAHDGAGDAAHAGGTAPKDGASDGHAG